MEVNLNSVPADYTVAWALLFIALALLALWGVCELWWNLKSSNSSKEKRKLYENFAIYGCVLGFVCLLSACGAWLFCSLAPFDESIDAAVSQIEQEYGFSLDTSQHVLIEEALSGEKVHGIDEDGNVLSNIVNKKDPYEEIVPMGSVWITRDDGSLVKGNFSFMLSRTDNDDIRVFDLVMESNGGEAIKKISPDEVKKYANALDMDADVSTLFETQDAETEEEN